MLSQLTSSWSPARVKVGPGGIFRRPFRDKTPARREGAGKMRGRRREDGTMDRVPLMRGIAAEVGPYLTAPR